MPNRKIKAEIQIVANKKTCGRCCYQTYGYCSLFSSSVVLAKSGDYERLDRCISAEVK